MKEEECFDTGINTGQEYQKGRVEGMHCSNMLLVHTVITIIRVEAPTSGDQSGQGLGF